MGNLSIIFSFRPYFRRKLSTDSADEWRSRTPEPGNGIFFLPPGLEKLMLHLPDLYYAASGFSAEKYEALEQTATFVQNYYENLSLNNLERFLNGTFRTSLARTRWRDWKEELANKKRNNEEHKSDLLRFLNKETDTIRDLVAIKLVLEVATTKVAEWKREKENQQRELDRANGDGDDEAALFDFSSTPELPKRPQKMSRRAKEASARPPEGGSEEEEEGNRKKKKKKKSNEEEEGDFEDDVVPLPSTQEMSPPSSDEDSDDLVKKISRVVPSKK